MEIWEELKRIKNAAPGGWSMNMAIGFLARHWLYVKILRMLKISYLEH